MMTTATAEATGVQQSQWVDLLINSAAAMHASGRPLVQRLLPDNAPPEFWTHYPEKDIVNGELGARYFYHCHDPAERDAAEHGHFHLFVALSAMPADISPLIDAPAEESKAERAEVVHLAALAIDQNGLPQQWFTTNRWVSGEYLFAAETLQPLLTKIDFRGEAGDPLVNQWLTAMARLSAETLSELLVERDIVLNRHGLAGEDRTVEICSVAAIDFDAILA